MNRRIRYLVMDVDGTLTDGKVYIGKEGEVCKAFNIKDGYGIHDIAMPNGILPMIITGRTSSIVLKRCKELGVLDIYQGINDKASLLKNLVSDLSTVAYMGDDLNDLPSMLLVKQCGGLVGCPNDAVTQVKQVADYIALHIGGEGAVRDFIDEIISSGYVQ